MATHQVGESLYTTTKLNALTALDLARRLGPVTHVLTGQLREDHVEGARLIGAISTGLMGQLPQHDWDFIRSTCLSAVRVRRQAGAKPVPIMHAGGGLQFEDIELSTLLELIDLVLQENLLPFFTRLSSMMTAPAPTGSLDEQDDLSQQE